MDMTVLFELGTLVRLLHIIGLVIGVGGVVSIDFMLALFHFRPKLASTISKISSLLSAQISTGLALLSITGLLLSLPRPWLIGDILFQAKLILVLVVFLNGIFFKLYVDPLFRKLSPEWADRTPAVSKFEKIAGMSAAISMIGWWAIVILSFYLVQ